MSNPAKISVLVSARKNSKYLAKFLMGYLERTHDQINTEILIMTSEHDDWNGELIDYFEGEHNMQFFKENFGMGRGGLHMYFNSLYSFAKGEWIIYFCEDHFITMDGWDNYVRERIVKDVLDPNDIWCLIPKFHNVGAMNQILSRGYVNALGGVLGKHGNIDSYINDVNLAAFGDSKDSRVVRFDDEMFYDFTHDQPNRLDDYWTKPDLRAEALTLPKYGDDRVKEAIARDAAKIKEAMDKEPMA